MLNNTLTNETQEHTENIINHDQVDSSQRCKTGPAVIDQKVQFST